MEKMGTSRLEAIVSLYCLNGFDDVEFFGMALEHDRKLLASWIVCEQSGKELSAHCDCVAGLDSLILKSVSPELPDELGCNLYAKSLANANYPTLPKKAEKISKGLQVTKKQQALVE
ncbi:hypothetical protein P5673_012091 [Acropora cervicornis]|uniref:Uncharacterized protein n=1 Tax=Acropora cervicornis TaxID=6130 RepID=A0AAD9QNK9_ACRCE|nr:hypothetical protein P5673_012091 [Acropora cervicornis]